VSIPINYEEAYGLGVPTGEDALILPIHFDKNISSDPLGCPLPSGYTKAQIVYSATNGTAATLTATSTYSSGTVTLTTSAVSLGALAGTAVKFQTTITGGTQADFTVKLTK
jgi:hypothetical protein